MLNLDDNTSDKSLLTGDQAQQVDHIVELYTKKAITANELEWQIRRIIQWNVYCNVTGGLRFSSELAPL